MKSLNLYKFLYGKEKNRNEANICVTNLGKQSICVLMQMKIVRHVL